jgi:hypothetical protein
VAAAISASSRLSNTDCIFVGDVDAGERLIDQFRRFKAPQRDWVARRAYADI